MQEIIPMIETTWKDYSDSYHYELVQINVDQTSPSHFMKDLIESEVIIVTCFNLKIARFMKMIRDDLQIDTRIFFYLHGLATIALWPLQRFGILPLLNSNDVFIGTCEGDLKSLAISVTNAFSVKIPFTLKDFTSPLAPTHKVASPLVFIGRISPQKNLDALILAYGKLDKVLRKNHPLFLYGREDNLGYPNLGIAEDNYLTKLQKIVDDNNLNDCVIFKGFIDRKHIQEELGNSFIFVSCSTHSDENFGMAAFRALLSGAYCILTSWGGHKEFARNFPDQIQYINPVLDINEITKAMEYSVQNLPENRPALPIEFSQEKIFSTFHELINLKNEAKSLVTTKLAEKIFSQQREFEKAGQIQRCFKSFDDAAFISYFEAYL